VGYTSVRHTCEICKRAVARCAPDPGVLPMPRQESVMIEQALLRTLTFVFSAAVLCAGGCKDTSSPNSGVPGEAVSPGGGGGTVAADSPAEDHAEATTGERAVVP